jgi:chromosome segregation ATPase
MEELETTLRGEIKEMEREVKDSEAIYTSTHLHIEQLEWQLKKTTAEKEKLKTALQEKDTDFTTLELKLQSKDREIRICTERRDIDKKKLESFLHEEKNFYDFQLRSHQKFQAFLYEWYKIQKEELQEKDGAIGELKETLHREYKELCEVRLQRDRANERIQELENKKQMMELKNKEVESSVRSKTKKLVAVGVAVGVVAAAGWWFFHKSSGESWANLLPKYIHIPNGENYIFYYLCKCNAWKEKI